MSSCPRAIVVALGILIATLLSGAAAFAMTYATVAAGGGHALALADDGTVWAWGFNDQGQLGDGTLQYSTAPVQVQGLPEIKAISAGYTSSMALGRDGTVWTWGSNQSGELGDGTATSHPRPSKISTLDQINAIAMGAGTAMALRTDGTVWLWGLNHDGAIHASHANVLTPVQMSGVDGVAGIGLGQSCLFVFTYDCALWGWGRNTFGQLGNGTTAPQSKPLRANLSACLTGLAVSNHAVALSSTGELWTWGYNREGQLGNNTLDITATPSLLTGPGNIVATACDQHTLALLADGSVWAWGKNDYGQLGDGSTENRPHPQPVAGLRTVTSIAAGAMFSLAVKADGSVWAWGRNNYGQLGDGSMDNRPSPVQVIGFDGVGLLNLKQPVAGQKSTTPDIPPISFAATPTTGMAPLTVAFQPLVDGGPAPVSIRWDFGDGEVANTKNPQHTFATPGSYIVTLNVTYSQDVFRESMKRIVVKAPW
jgi:alpha-tubulin suppressor-like RCC1 family protein